MSRISRSDLRDESTHQQAEKCLERIEACLVLEEGLRTGDEGPGANQERNPSIGTELLANQAARKLSREEAQEEDL